MILDKDNIERLLPTAGTADVTFCVKGQKRMRKMNGTMAALVLALGAGFANADTVATADFTKSPGKLKPALHSTSWATRAYPRGFINDDEAIRSLKQHAFRTHDAPLCNPGQHVVDTHEMFPLMHLDAKDPKNYVFKPTDHYLEINFALGMKCLYRMGSSIEHTGDWGYNTLNPKDHAKYAEVLAGIIRHYTKGWGDGFQWGDRFVGWELFNEPDVAACWRGTKDEFIDLFITCLRRIKSEFPELRVGGPAFGWLNEKYMRDLLRACKKAGVSPDFISWHLYADSPLKVLGLPEKARRICDEEGFSSCELVMDEWHYLPNGSWNGIQGATSPDMVQRVQEGVTGVKGIDSAVFTIQVETGFHDTPLAESYYYGAGYDGCWGYVDRYRRFEKVFYAVRMVGEMMSACEDRALCTVANSRYSAFGAWTKDRKGAQLVITDFRGTEQVLDVEVRGLEKAKRVTVKVLDDAHDFVPTKNFDWHAGKLSLVKSDRRSVAFLVEFEL